MNSCIARFSRAHKETHRNTFGALEAFRELEIKLIESRSTAVIFHLPFSVRQSLMSPFSVIRFDLRRSLSSESAPRITHTASVAITLAIRKTAKRANRFTYKINIKTPLNAN